MPGLSISRMALTLTRAKGGGAVPGLDLDFVRGRYALNSPHGPSLPAGWSYSRTGVATAETSSGQIVTFAPNVPRITDRGLLVEEARTNLLLDSQNPNSGWWSRNNAAFTANQALGPDGTMSAGLLVDNAVTGEHNVVQTPSIVGSTTYTQTWIVKRLNHRYVGAGWFSNFNSIGVPARSAIFDLVAGTVSLPPTADIGAVASIRALADGWFALRISAPSGAGATGATCALRLMTGNDWNTSSVTYAGTGTGIYVWNGQMEAGSTATSPIITTGAPATRGADLVSMSGLTSLLNETSPYTIVVEALWTPQTTTAFALEGVSVAGNVTGATLGTNGTGRRSRPLHRSGANRSDGTEVIERTTGQIARMAVTSEGRLAAFGGVIASTASPAQSNWSSDGIRIGHRSDALGSSPSGYWNNYIRRIRIRPSAATDTELQTFTSAVNGWTESDGLDTMALFTGGVPGAWYDPSDLSTLFQDAAGTIPVTADGQFVGRMLDKSGNGRHLTQGTSASRPVFREASGLRWLEGDGLDDWLQGSVSGWTALTSVIAYADPNTTTSGAVVFEISAAVRSNGLMQIDSGSPVATTARRAIVRGAAFAQQASSITTQALGAPVVRSIQARQDDFAFWQDGVSTGTDNSGVWPNSPVTAMSLFAGTGGVSFGTPRFFGLVVRAPQLLAGERQSIERVLALRSGVTLSA